MTTIYFTNHQKVQLVDILKKYPCIIYVKKLPWMWISKVCTQIKPKVSVPRNWNSVNDVIILLPKDISNNFTKAMFSLRDITKNASDK